MDDDAIIVFLTAANGEEATRLADMLVGAHLAACVQIHPEMESVYRWQGKIERSSEVLLLVKTIRGKFDELENLVGVAIGDKLFLRPLLRSIPLGDTSLESKLHRVSRQVIRSIGHRDGQCQQRMRFCDSQIGELLKVDAVH